MNKLAKFAHKPAVKKVCGLFFSALMIVSMALPSFAAELDEPIDFSQDAVTGMQTVLSYVTSTLSVQTIVNFLAAAVAIAIGFFVFWWGVRKVIKIVRKAFASGKVSV